MLEILFWKRKKLEEERAVRRDQKKTRDALICESFNQGLEYKEIAVQSKCCLRTVNRVINKHHPRAIEKNKRHEEIRQLYLTGMPYKEISIITGLSIRTINNTLSTLYPKDRPKPWEDIGKTKEEFYEQYKKDNP